MQFNIKLTPAIIKALARGIVNLVGAFDRHLAGAAMLVLIILSIGAAMALSHAQIVLA